MRGPWAWPPGVGLLLALALLAEAAATHIRRTDGVRRVDKIFVTTQLERRDDGVCPTNYSLCPASLGGGCCPDSYGCETDSCIETARPTCRGNPGYAPCGIDVGGQFPCGLHDVLR